MEYVVPVIGLGMFAVLVVCAFFGERKLQQRRLRDPEWMQGGDDDYYTSSRNY